MTQNLKIEVLTGDISIDGTVVSNLVTKEELSTAIVKKADLGTDGKIPTNQLPAEIVNTPGIVDEVKLQLETSIKDAVDESNAYAESYTDNALSSKADLTSGKVSLEQLPAIDQYPQFGTALSNLSTSILTSVKQRTDQLEKAKADLGEDGKVLREQIPSYEKISGLPEQLEVMSTQTAAVSKELGVHKLQTADQIDTLKENIEANVQQLTDRQSHLMRTYATKELGVDSKVGVKPGEYFYVRSVNEDKMLVEYQNVGGAATPSGKSYPSASYVDRVSEFTALPFSDGKSYKLNERVQLENGDIVKSTVANNIVDPNVDMMGWINTADKDYVGLSNVDNTSDIDKPVSTATDLAIIAATRDKVSDQELVAALSPKADLTYVDAAVGAISTDASKQYATLALANADIANIALNKNVFVSEETNGGYWYKAAAGATSLTKSPYDPLAQAKTFTTAIKENIVFDNVVGDWLEQSFTFPNAGKRIRKANGVIEAQSANNYVTNFIPIKRGMQFTLNTVSATPDFPWYALYDKNQVFIGAFAPITSHSPHIATTLNIKIEQDGYLVAWMNNQYVSNNSLVLSKASDIYVAPTQVKSLGSAVVKTSDVLSLDSANKFTATNLTKKTFVADYMTKTVVDPVITSFYQETQGATNASVKPALVGGKLTYSGEFLPSASLPFRLILAFYIEHRAAAKTADRRFTVMIKGRAKGTNYTIRKVIADQHTQVAVDNINAEAWTEFDLMIQSDFRGILQGADSQWGLNIAAIDIAVKADVQLEFDHFMLIDTQDNFLKADYLSIVNSKTIYIANQTLPHVSRGNWFGKKMVTLGHSIVYQNKWQDLLAHLIGATYNMAETRGTVTQQPLALGGSWLRAAYSNATLWTFASKPTQSDGYRNSSIYYRADWVAQYNPDLILIFNPVNDSTTPSIVGEITDPVYTGAEVFYTDVGAPTVISSLKGIFKKLGEQNTKARIVFCSDILGGFVNGDVDSALSKLSNANLVARHNKIKAVCELYGVQFVDLLHDAWNVYEASSCYNPADMIHPNDLGGEKIARSIAPKL